MPDSAMLAMFLLASGGGGDAPKLPHAEPELETLLWVWGIFLVLLAILWRFAWKPLLAAVEAREKRIADSLTRAEELQKASAEIAKKQDAAMAEAHAKAKAMLDEARGQAEEFRKRETEKARLESEGFLDRAKKEIGLEEARVRDALRKDVVDLTIQAATQVLGRAVTGADDRRLADEAVAEILSRRVGTRRN